MTDTESLRARTILMGWLEAQHLLDGARLPSERDLAEHLSLSRAAVRRALQAIESDGLVVRRDDERLAATMAPRSLAGSVVVFTSSATIPLPNGPPAREDPRRVWLGMVSELAARNLPMVTVPLHGEIRPSLRRIERERPLGCICLMDAVATGVARQVVDAAWPASIPVVMHGDCLVANDLDRWPADLVAADQSTGAEMLVDWLVAHGRTCIQSVTERPTSKRPLDLWWVALRRAGISKALLRHGLTSRPWVHILRDPEFDFSSASLDEQARITAGYLLEACRAGVDAMMLINDGMAYDVGMALRLFDREPNRDILLAGYDHHHHLFNPILSAHARSRPIVTIDKDEPEIGRQLVTLLVERAQRRLPPEPQRRLVAPRLIEIGEP